ncbi:hypothetical protein PV325_010172, partial [Microctonus aethiopoides]
VWSIDSCEDISEESSPEVYHHESRPLSHVKINIKKHDLSKSPKQVNLKLTTRALANENLPVWIVNGVIDANNLRDENFNALQRNYEVCKLLINRKSYSEGPDSGVNKPNLRTYKKRVFDGYPEILVVVDWSTAQNWNSNMISNLERSRSQHRKLKGLDLYSSIVSYVITLFNGVDMLYSKLKKTKIQINIAGIVIGSAEDTFTFLNECFIKPPDAEKSMDPVCAFKQFKLFFESNERTIPTGSYDFIVYLT